MFRRKLLVIGGVLTLLLVAAMVLWQGRSVNATVGLAGLSTWSVGPNTVVVRRVEVGDWVWGGSIESPPRALEPLLRRFPALHDWWASTHREYALGLPNKEYVLVDLEVHGPNQQVVLGALRPGVVTPDGVIPSNSGSWAQVTGKPAEMHATIEVPRGTNWQALELRLGEQRTTIPVRR